MMKFKTLSTLSTLHRSNKRDDQPRQQPRASAPAAIIPPKKVIRALYDFRAETVHELSFREGDYFHVIANEDDPDWFEAYNPLTNSRGMVPVSYFHVLSKTDRRLLPPKSPTPPVSKIVEPQETVVEQQSPQRQLRQPSPQLQLQQQSYQRQSQQQSPQRQSQQRVSRDNRRSKREPLYGVALYEFVPERPDELPAIPGDPLVIIAQSTDEWFVAMHPGKLGGPGLIPVSFVEIRDPETGVPIQEDVQQWIRRQGIELPGVEEWKRMNGISDTSARSSLQHRKTQSSASLPINKVADIEEVAVESYIAQEDQYWFHISLQFKNGRKCSVFRLYEDFYNFQLHLLESFPAEAANGNERILPFMPGPLSFVNEILTAQRRADLDVYVKELIALPGYIRECELMRGFFGLDEEYDEAEEELMYKQYQREQQTQRISLETPGRSRRDSPRVRSGDERSRSSDNRSPAPRGSKNGLTDEYNRPGPPTSVNDTLKVKVQFGEDLLAIRIPARASFGILWERVRERLDDRVRQLRWKDTSGELRPLEDSEDLQRALHDTGGKLLLVAN